MLALLVQPGAALEIGHTTVKSTLGEPLDATVRIIPAPGERIDATCLSLIRAQGLAQSGHVLINDAALSQPSGSDSIHISTATPVTQSAVTLTLRAQCSSGPAVVRTINLNVNPALASIPGAARPGSTFTVRSGDSIYKLARLIYPHNETAVRNLAHAIVLANPALFPDARARPLQIGERLIIPDLRTVNQIIAASTPAQTGMQNLRPAQAHAGKAARQTQAKAETVKSAPGTQSERPAQSKSADNKSAYKVLGSGKLRLKLSTGLALGEVRPQAGTKSTAKRPSAAVAPPTHAADKLTSLQLSRISSRIDRLHVLQDELNARIARLEINAAALQKVFVHNEALQRARPPSVNRPAASQTVPPTPPRAAANNRRSMMLQSQWFIIGGLAIVLLLAGLLLLRMFRNQRNMSQHRKRIDAMLGEARSAATPLLGNEPRSRANDKASAFATSEPTREDDSETDYISDEEMLSDSAAEFTPAVEEVEPVKDPWRDAGAADTGFGTHPSETDEIPIWLRIDMDKAMDSTRSMFSDVDRFITLGRIENAISLLEFQIKRSPAERNAWIKLMAVYRDRGMDDNFDRTYAAFREQFGDKPGY